MIRGYEVYGRKPGIPKADVEAKCFTEYHNPPCTVSQMSAEDIAKYGPPTMKIENRARTFNHIKKNKKGAKK